MGKYRTLQSLATLAYDCRRGRHVPRRAHGGARPSRSRRSQPGEMTGAWAGEIGQMQFVPTYYMDLAVDYDGDGKRNLVKSVPDVLASSANS